MQEAIIGVAAGRLAAMAELEAERDALRATLRQQEACNDVMVESLIEAERQRDAALALLQELFDNRADWIDHQHIARLGYCQEQYADWQRRVTALLAGQVETAERSGT